MPKPVKQLKAWFNALPRKQKKKVLAFIYDRALLREGRYVGPAPEVVRFRKGLFCGPAPVPDTSSVRCPQCGRPF
jgi:hypothetical protein